MSWQGAVQAGKLQMVAPSNGLRSVPPGAERRTGERRLTALGGQCHRARGTVAER